MLPPDLAEYAHHTNPLRAWCETEAGLLNGRIGSCMSPVMRLADHSDPNTVVILDAYSAVSEALDAARAVPLAQRPEALARVEERVAELEALAAAGGWE